MREPTRYEIRVREVLDEKWAAYFAPLSLDRVEDETILRENAHDQGEGVFSLPLPGES